MSAKTPQRILAFVDDFFFIPKIENKLETMFEIKFIENNNQIFENLIEEFLPILILIDMNHRSFDWAGKINSMKNNPKVKDIPVLMYGSHKDVQSFSIAKKIGIDKVVAKSRFVKDMEDLVKNLIIGN